MKTRSEAVTPATPVALDPRGGFADGRVTLAGRTVDGSPVDAVVLAVRGSEDEVIAPASGAEFDVAIDLPVELPAKPFSVDVHLQTRDASGQIVRRRLTAEPGLSAEVASATGRVQGRPAWWYATRGGYLCLRVGVERQPRLDVAVTALRRTPDGVQFDAELATVRVDGAQAELEITIRTTDVAVRAPLTLVATERDPLAQDALWRVSGSVDLRALADSGLPDGEQAVDVAVVAPTDEGAELRHGLSVPDESAGFRRLRPVASSRAGRTQLFVPFLTFKSKNLAFAREHFADADYRYLNRLRRLGPLWSLIRVFSWVWLIGETAYKAQDGGFHLFRWIRRERPGLPVRYVIDAHSPERAAVEPLGQVVTMRSREHIRACFLARRFATTHKADFVLATSDRRAVRWMRGTRVFLQHGVLGTKNMTDTYGRLAPGFHTDFFHVSSQREREIVVNDLRYRPAQVRVTGLSRYDRLLEPGDEPRGLLVIPTWRDWLLRPTAFAESEFLARWRAFVDSAPLRQAIAGGLPVTVILHPNMRFYGEALQAEGVTVLGQGDVDVQTLLRSHQAMVTDYSSVGFDFSFLGRPVFYFQFDRDRFLGRRPSHLDLDQDLPGDVFGDADRLAEAVVDCWRSGFVQSAEHAERSRRFRDPADDYCQAVFASVRSARSWRVPLWRLRDSALGRQTYRRFRDSGVYPNAMRALGWIGRRLPRRRLAVFESGLGRAVADSPRAIYEELARRDLGVQTVWSTRGAYRPPDLATRKVEPGSPGFHWALARARWWVNNQNFGPQVTPARGTTYLQTWHGTPLKRMQHDAVTTKGRAPGYLERVSRKTATWSLLLSPSDYATEAFRSAFGYDGPVLQTGYPRNDVLAADAEKRGRLTRRRLGLSDEDRLVLYAPTFRDDVTAGGRFAWDAALDWASLLAALDERTRVLVRRHDVVRGSLRIPPELADRIVDVTSYPDMQDLLCAADVLVTDYSSVMFDFAILDRPIVLFCYDLEHYRDDVRGFYFDLTAEAPGPIAVTQAELEAALAGVERDPAADADRRRAFRERFAPLDDGQAARRVVDAIFVEGQ